MIFTSYFDEADTDGEMPDMIMACHFGHAYQWERFEKKLPALQKRHGFKIFHGKDFKGRHRAFSYWTDEQCEALIKDLVGLGSKLTETHAFSLTRERYLNEYRSPPIPRKMQLDTQYGVCFRACMAGLVDYMSRRQFRDRLFVIFEDGAKNVGDCQRIFFDLKKYYLKQGLDFLGTFSVDTKDNCMPLMLSDFLATSYSIMKDAKQVGFRDFIAEMTPPEAKGTVVNFHELKPNALQKLKDDFQSMRLREQAEWRARKDARKRALAGQSS